MSPLNWFVAIAETALVTGLLASQTQWVKVVCAVLVFGVLAFYGYVYHYFMKNDPDRLQTEEFNLQTMTLLGPGQSAKPVITVHPVREEIVDASHTPMTKSPHDKP
jgi:membrane protein implicated in regulation of membrane protease activity